MSDQLLETFEDGIATLTMNRPEARNALTGELLDALAVAVPRLALDPKVRVVVLTGAGSAFCAGGDIKGFVAAPTGSSGKSDAPFSMEQRFSGLRKGMETANWLH